MVGLACVCRVGVWDAEGAGKEEWFGCVSWILRAISRKRVASPLLIASRRPETRQLVSKDSWDALERGHIRSKTRICSDALTPDTGRPSLRHSSLRSELSSVLTMVSSGATWWRRSSDKFAIVHLKRHNVSPSNSSAKRRRRDATAMPTDVAPVVVAQEDL